MTKPLNMLPSFQLTVGDSEDDVSNIYQTSLVKNPATEKVWSVFSKQVETVSKEFQKNLMVFKSDSVGFERLVSGVWFMPDTLYFRRDGDFEFTVSITRDELKKALKNHLKMSAGNYHNVEHTDSLSVWGLVAIEHWIIESPDTKSPVMGYSLQDLGYTAEEIPLGTVMKTLFIRDETLFNNMILPDMSGEAQLKGFSIEGLFDIQKMVTKMKSNMQVEGEQTKVEQMFKEIGLIQTEGNIILEDQTVINFERNLIKSKEVLVENGDFKTKQGFNIIVRDGKLVDFGFDLGLMDIEPPVLTANVPVVTPVVEPVVEVITEPEAKTDTVVEIVETPVVEPIVTVENPVGTEVAYKEKLDETKTELDKKSLEITELQKKISELEAKVADEVKAKEDLIKSQPIPTAPKTVGKPADYSEEKYLKRTVSGIDYYIPKK